MDFRFDGDTLDLRDGAQAFFQGETPASRLRDMAEGGNGLALWPKLAEMGLLGAGAGEEAGGLGLSADALLLLCEEAGRAGLPEPYSETAGVLVPALVALGDAGAAYVEKVVTGEARGVILHALAPLTNYAAEADFALVCAPGNVRIVDGKSLIVAARDSIDPGRSVSIVNAGAGTEILSGAEADAFSAEVAARGAACASAEMCGLTARMIELATDYSKDRQQFGVAIGTFQAVKHLMANAQVKLEFARPVVYRAGGVFTGDAAKRDLAVSHSKIAATDAAIFAGENAIQVFGGMGYTFEVDLHFFMKRAWALAGVWGDRNHHFARIDSAILGGTHPVGPGETF